MVLSIEKAVPQNMEVFKGTDSQDWGGLLMVKTDKVHFLNVARARLY